MEKIYCISGIGADQRIFRNLHIAGYELCPIPWLPFEGSDTVASYAVKLSKLIPDTNPVIIGLSFGGMLATEIGKMRPTRKIFLVSSAKMTDQLPRIGKWPAVDKLIDLIPERMFRDPGPIGLKLAGAITADDKSVLTSMMNDISPAFMKWALKAVVRWNNAKYPPDIIQIHGTADRIIPFANVHPDYTITGGTHVMIYNRAAEVSNIISDCLAG